jgi:hypothetical protein
MSSATHNFILFLGRFHPVLVHLPIGGLVLLGALELAARFSRFKDAARNRHLILGLTAAASVVTAVCGWLLAGSGGYDVQLLQWHRWAGVGLVVACGVTFLACLAERPQAYRPLLVLTLALLMVAGHLGASITHGRDFLTRYAPIPWRVAVASSTGPSATEVASSAQTQWPVYAEVIDPIFQRRCIGCHGPEKHKADLRLDHYAGLRKGGKSGPLFVAGNPSASLLIQRLVLPLEDEDHMPPKGEPQPTPLELGLLQLWISASAPEEFPSAAPQSLTAHADRDGSGAGDEARNATQTGD